MELSAIFKSNRELINTFSTEQECIDFLELKRWEGKVISPYDASSKVYKCKNNWYKCKSTKKLFNVRTGTLFENSKIGLTKWLEAIYYITSRKKGVALCQTAVTNHYTKIIFIMLSSINKNNMWMARCILTQ